MSLTVRDMDLLEGLGIFRVLTLAQIREHYFNGLVRPLVQRRLGRLRDKGYLRAFPFGDSGTLAWTLTSDGARLIRRSPKVFRRPPNRNTLPHDLAVAEIGLRLRRLGLLHDWMSAYEIELGTDDRERHIPDAVFRLKVGEEILGPIGLEVENSLKSRTRINEMLFEYRTHLKMTDLWLFWRKEWMGRIFRETPTNVEPRIWIGARSIADGVCLELEDLSGEQLDLESLTDTPADIADINPEETEYEDEEEDNPSDSARFTRGNTPMPAVLIARDPSLTTMCEKGVTAGTLDVGCWEGNERELEGEDKEQNKNIETGRGNGE